MKRGFNLKSIKFKKRKTGIAIVLAVCLCATAGLAANTLNSDAFEKVIVDDNGYVDESIISNRTTYDGNEMVSFSDDTPQVEGMFSAVLQSTYQGGNSVSTQSDVTAAMCSPSYWINQSLNPTRLLMTKSEIVTLNANTVATSATHMHDLEAIATTYDGDSLKASLAGGIETTDPTISQMTHANNVAISDMSAYWGAIKSNVSSATTTTSDSIKYGIVTTRTEMYAYPTADFIGYGANDTDNENVESAAIIGEPVVLKTITADSQFAFCYTTSCTGWIKTSDIAICSSKTEWQNSWKVDPLGNDFLVVATDKIILEDSFYNPTTANVELTMGCTLKLVPESAKPASIVDRGVWNSYVVYLPTRKADGSLETKMALISEHYSVNEGYLPLTQENVLKVAFECLGNRYGWGGSLRAMDCSMYVRQIYKCFGFDLPRNTTWQRAIPGSYSVDLSGMTDAQKEAFLRNCPAGTILYFSGHEFMYTGEADGSFYQISATGSLYDQGSFHSEQTVILTSLNVKRGNGKTWLTNMDHAVTFGKSININDSLISGGLSGAAPTYTGDYLTPAMTIKDGDSVLRNGIDYTISYSDNISAGTGIATVTGAGRYYGTRNVSFEIRKASYQIDADNYVGPYDGKAHTIYLDGIMAGSTAQFRIGNSSKWVSKLPARINAGVTTVYYEITHPNYETISGMNIISIGATGGSGSKAGTDTDNTQESDSKPEESKTPPNSSDSSKDEDSSHIGNDGSTTAGSPFDVVLPVCIGFVIGGVLVGGIFKFKLKRK